MNGVTSDVLLEKMFLARQIGLLASAAILAVALAVAFPFVLFVALGVFFIVLIASSVAVCYYVYRVGRQEAGLKYALGHLLLCIALTPVAFVVGILLVPLLIRSDVERLRQCEHETAQFPSL